jgi:hypothetical protein
VHRRLPAILGKLFGRTLPAQEKPPTGTAPPPRPDEWPDEGELFRVSAADPIYRRDLYEGTAVFGQIGSGKTSGSGALILSSLIGDGWGGFIATTKPGEAEGIKSLCARLGRTGDVIHIRPEAEHFFNWLEWEQHRPSEGAGLSLNTAETLTTFTGFIKPEQTNHSSDNAHFFQENATRWFVEALDLIASAGATPNLELVGDIITQAPQSAEEVASAEFSRGPIGLLLHAANARGGNVKERRRAHRVHGFWTREVFRGSDRAQRDIGLTLQTSLFRLQQDPIRELIASERGCSFLPVAPEVGGILLFDAPAMVYGPAGRFLTRMHKLLFQQAMSRRADVTVSTRPVFLYCDEAQSYLVPGDADYQALCRDRRAATIYLSQNFDNYATGMGGRERAEQLLANFTLKIFHANSGTTNDWASKLIANAWQDTTSHSYGERGQGPEARPTHNTSISPHIHPQVLAGEFTRLRTGGTAAGKRVDAIVFKPGRRFALTGGPHLRTTFQQG